MQTRSAFFCGFGSAMLVAVVALVCTFERTSAEPKVLASQSADAIQTSNAGIQYLLAKQSYEDHWRTKIERAVSFIPGVVVAVDVTLARETVYLEKSHAHNEPPVVSVTRSETTSSRSGNAKSSTAAKLAEELSPRPLETEATSDETVVNLLPEVDRTIERTLFVPEVVTIAISASRGYLAQILRSRAEGEDVDQPRLEHLELDLTTTIEKLAVALIPKAPPGEDTFPRVTVIWHEEPGTGSPHDN